jgi:hypothetical protein
MAQNNLAGNVYVRDQLVHVQENGRWKLAQIRNLYDCTVIDAATETEFHPAVDKVRPTGQNTNIMVGDRVRYLDADRDNRWHNGIFISTNYNVMFDGIRMEKVPHTRMRPAPVIPRIPGTSSSVLYFRRGSNANEEGSDGDSNGDLGSNGDWGSGSDSDNSRRSRSNSDNDRGSGSDSDSSSRRRVNRIGRTNRRRSSRSRSRSNSDEQRRSSGGKLKQRTIKKRFASKK